MVLAVALALTAVPAAAARPRPPVVMIVFDEFPADAILTPSGRIDARRFPGFAALARNSTWFPNAHAAFDSTPGAVPAILAGDAPAPTQGPSYLSHPRSVFTLLAGHGYRVRALEEATTVCPPRICPRSPGYGNTTHNALSQRRERLNATLASLRPSRRPVFTFHHSLLPHQPWIYLPSGRRRIDTVGSQLPPFNWVGGFGDLFLTRHNEQRHLLQIGFADRAIGRLVARLRRKRLLRRALVVVTADHGMAFQVGVGDRRAVSAGNVELIAPVPLFVKAPGQRRGNVNRAYASSLDVLPTIASLLGLPLRRELPGASAFSAAVRRRPGVRIYTRDFRTLTVPARVMERRRRAVRDERARHFGTGPWSGVFRIGPRRDVLNRRATATAASAVTAVFAVPKNLGSVDPRGPNVPTQASGTLTGGLPGQTRDLALAVNGRIRAVARSFHMQDNPAEYFSLTFPGAHLRRGANTFELFEVTGARGALALLGARD